MYKIADAHCDYLGYKVIKGEDKDRLFDHIDTTRMKKGGVALQNFAVWVPPEAENKLELGLEQIDFFQSYIEKSGGDIRKCIHSGDLAADGICAVLSIESGESIGCRNDYIPYAYDKGARILSLTWNDENSYASGCLAHGGLKADGIAAVKLLNSLKIALDVSHINEKGFGEALDLYAHAPCATHSCVFDLNKSPRNLKNDQIRELINRDGFIGINFYTEFLKGRYADIDDILDHIDYVLDFGGENIVGFGSDFCGIQYTPKGLDSVADFQALPEAMLRRNYAQTVISKICYGNFARYILKFLKQ